MHPGYIIACVFTLLCLFMVILLDAGINLAIFMTVLFIPIGAYYAATASDTAGDLSRKYTGGCTRGKNTNINGYGDWDGINELLGGDNTEKESADTDEIEQLKAEFEKLKLNPAVAAVPVAPAECPNCKDLAKTKTDLVQLKAELDAAEAAKAAAEAAKAAAEAAKAAADAAKTATEQKETLAEAAKAAAEAAKTAADAKLTQLKDELAQLKVAQAAKIAEETELTQLKDELAMLKQQTETYTEDLRQEKTICDEKIATTKNDLETKHKKEIADVKNKRDEQWYNMMAGTNTDYNASIGKILKTFKDATNKIIPERQVSTDDLKRVQSRLYKICDNFVTLIDAPNYFMSLLTSLAYPGMRDYIVHMYDKNIASNTDDNMKGFTKIQDNAKPDNADKIIQYLTNVANAVVYPVKRDPAWLKGDADTLHVIILSTTKHAPWLFNSLGDEEVQQKITDAVTHNTDNKTRIHPLTKSILATAPAPASVKASPGKAAQIPGKAPAAKGKAPTTAGKKK